MDTSSSPFLAPILGIHRGAIDQSTITTQPPQEVMKRVDSALRSLGIQVDVESDYKYFCVRPKKEGAQAASAPVS
jgi:protein-serine/threonine kinase